MWVPTPDLLRQLLNYCSVHFLAEDPDGETVEVTAFERTILAAFPTVGFDDVAEKLLTSPLLKIQLGKDNIVYSIDDFLFPETIILHKKPFHFL